MSESFAAVVLAAGGGSRFRDPERRAGLDPQAAGAPSGPVRPPLGGDRCRRRRGRELVVVVGAVEPSDIDLPFEATVLVNPGCADGQASSLQEPWPTGGHMATARWWWASATSRARAVAGVARRQPGHGHTDRRRHLRRKAWPPGASRRVHLARPSRLRRHWREGTAGGPSRPRHRGRVQGQPSRHRHHGGPRPMG